MDPYRVLGINPDATQDEIHMAYRKKAKEYHPDINKNANAAETFKCVNQAYEMLKNVPTLRKERHPPTPEDIVKEAEKKAYKEEQARRKQKHMENLCKAQKAQTLSETENTETISMGMIMVIFAIVCTIIDYLM